MILSMTAFAREDAETPWGSLSWELKTVNHRYLDVSLRLPEELRALDPAVREALAARLSRGKVDATLRFQPLTAAAGFELDESMASRVLEAAARLAHLESRLAPLSAAELLRWPGVLRSAVPDPEALAQSARDLLARAVETLVATRAREGARLKELIGARVESAARIAANTRTVLPAVQETLRARLLERLKEVRESLDPARLEQEMVLYATRADVAEELDRLDTHLAEVARLLAAGGAIGRRLDFLMQELHREANTLGSKSADMRLTNASVELKVLIDQMREQVQNIE
jgi:uncharacterized protein (TIGR00255 family)